MEALIAGRLNMKSKAEQKPTHFETRLLISSAPRADLNATLLGSLIYEEDYKVS